MHQQVRSTALVKLHLPRELPRFTDRKLMPLGKGINTEHLVAAWAWMIHCALLAFHSYCSLNFYYFLELKRHGMHSMDVPMP